MTNPTQTTGVGAQVADNQFPLTAGPRGPVLMDDSQLSLNFPTHVASLSK